MKKVCLGSMMFLGGILSFAVILAGSMANGLNVNGDFSAFWNLSQYGIMPAMYVFIGISIIGILLAIWGIFEKKN